MRRMRVMLMGFGLAVAAATGASAKSSCDSGPALAAMDNRTSITTMAWAPFGRPEQGWHVYAPAIAHEIGSACPFGSRGFAGAVARWQAERRLPAHGRIGVPTMAAMVAAWHGRRPFVALRGKGLCPDAPPATALAIAAVAEGYGGKAILVVPAALANYRRMVADARRALPQAGAGSDWLRIFSGFRDPVEDAARCAAEGNCGGPERANCSVHRTGTAIDVYVGQAPGWGPDSTADANRLAMTQTPVYRWLVANAGRYGFVNYVFEPWHWEWVGKP